MDIDLDRSWCVGNSSRDIEAGLRAGCKTILIDMPPAHQKQISPPLSLAGVNPDYKAVNIKEAVNIIKKYLRSPVEQQKQAEPVPASQTEAAPQTADEVAESPEQIETQQPAPEVQEPEIQHTEPPIQALESPIKPPAEPQIPADKTEELLSSILGQLKSMQRTEMFGEFSVMRLMAGILQIVVLFCLLVTVWFLMSPERQDNSVFIALGFAIIFQLMTLTFYIMQGKK